MNRSRLPSLRYLGMIARVYFGIAALIVVLGLFVSLTYAHPLPVASFAGGLVCGLISGMVSVIFGSKIRASLNEARSAFFKGIGHRYTT
jgi:hydrogenase/urease accessory protein HupE